MRATVATARQSRLPRALGLCAGNIPEICEWINAATQRLINAGGETGWVGGWTRVVFQVDTSDPYITLPRTLARVVHMAYCQTPMRINNEWYEFLPGGIGIMPTSSQPDWCGEVAGYDRGMFPTARDIDTTNKFLRVYYTDSRDIGAKILITGLDQNGHSIFSTLGSDTIDGFTIAISSPFTDGEIAGAKVEVSQITAVQKDITHGDVILMQVDLTTGAEVQLARYAPTETNPSYRRYYITKLPGGCCCDTNTGTVQVTALGKREFIPVYQDTDQLMIGNIEALIEECQSIRYAEMDSTNGLQLAAVHHAAAIKLLQNEIVHAYGRESPAINVDIFDQCPLDQQSIGSLT